MPVMGGELLTQPRIGIVLDCDKTASPEYMQAPVLRRYGINETAFWRDKEAYVAETYAKGLDIDSEMGYLNLMAQCAHGRRIKWEDESGKEVEKDMTADKDGSPLPLSNAVLRECGRDLRLFPGLPDMFPRLQRWLWDVRQHEYQYAGIELKYFMVSTGLKKVLEGSQLAPVPTPTGRYMNIPEGVTPFMADVFGCEYREDANGVIAEVVRPLLPTQKTFCLFEISKGAPYLVNARMEPSLRVIPFEHMIYVGDGPSDIPCFAVMNDHGGVSLAVYDTTTPGALEKSFGQCVQLLEGDRIEAFAPADYNEGSQIDLLLKHRIRKMAEEIVGAQQLALRRGTVSAVGHLDPFNLERRKREGNGQ